MRPVTPTLLPRYDPSEMAAADDLYALYARLRHSAPVFRGGPGQWVITRYADVARLLDSSRLGNEYSLAQRQFSFGDGPASTFFGNVVLYRDPPAHGHLRSALRQVMESSLISALRARLPTLIDELLEPGLDSGTLEIVDDLAIPLAFRVICHLVGFPLSDLRDIQPRAVDLSRAFGTRISKGDREAADEAVAWLRRYVSALLDHRRRAPCDDVLSAIAQQDDGTTREDQIDNVAFLLFAGFETTAHLLANGIAALVDHPDEFARLRTQPALVNTAVEELLRYDPPIQGVARVVREPLTVADIEIRRERVLVLLIGSANRDEDQFANPDRLDLARQPNAHLSFGGGIHYCLGATVARLEVAAVLARLAQRVRMLTAAGAAVRKRDTRFRCYSALPVGLRTA